MIVNVDRAMMLVEDENRDDDCNVDQVKEKLLKILAMIVHVDRANMIDIVEDPKDLYIIGRFCLFVCHEK